MLAHRGSHWTTLQRVCQTVWDQSCRINVLGQGVAQLEPPSPITADQLHTTFTPLLVLATDLIMDMMKRLEVSVTYSYTHTVAAGLKQLKHIIVPFYQNMKSKPLAA